MDHHIANGIFLWMSCPTYTGWQIRCFLILLTKIIIIFLTSNLSSQVKHSTLQFQEDPNLNLFFVIFLILIKTGTSLMISAKSYWDILLEHNIKLPFLIFTTIDPEKLQIQFTIIQRQFTLSKKIHKFLHFILIYQSIQSLLTKLIKRKPLSVKFTLKKHMKSILVKLTSDKILSLCLRTNKLQINKAQTESIFYGHQNHSVRDVEKPEELTIFLSLLVGTKKDVPQVILLKSESVIRNYWSLGFSMNFTKRNLSHRKKEVFLKPFQVPNFFNLLRWIGLKSDCKFVVKASTC